MVFIDLKDRELKGIVGREKYEDVLRQLKDDFGRLEGRMERYGIIKPTCYASYTIS